MWFLLFLFSLIPLLSAPVGNPSAPALLQEGVFISDLCWSNPQLEFVKDFLLQKKLRASHECKEGCPRKASLSSTAQVGNVIWSIKERFNIQAQLGAGQLQWNWIQQGQMIQGRSNEGFLWSGVAKLVLLEVKDTSLGAAGQAGGWDKMRGHVQLNGLLLEGKAKLKLRYWQAGAALTQKIGIFAPYIGILANQTRFKIRHLNSGTAQLYSQVIAGPFLGCTLTGTRFYLNVEWRGWFEQGLAFSGQIRF